MDALSHTLITSGAGRSRRNYLKWRNALTGVSVVMAMTGCPSEFGKNGRVDQAAHRDTLEISRRRCSPEEERQYCGNGREHSQECRDHCGS